MTPKALIYLMALIPFALAGNTACSPAKGDELADGNVKIRTIASQKLSGTFDGQPFAAGKVVANRLITARGEQVALRFAPAGANFGCQTRDAELFVTASAPAKVGSYTGGVETGGDGSATFTRNQPNEPLMALIASTMMIRIDSITATEVRGGLSAFAKNKYASDVSGEFVAEICP